MLTIDSTHDQAFLADLHAARLHALGVLRSILNLATLPPQARAELLKNGHSALALLRESRLAAAQILQLPLPEGGGRGVGSSITQINATSVTPPRATSSPPPRRQPVQEPTPHTRASTPPHDHADRITSLPPHRDSNQWDYVRDPSIITYATGSPPRRRHPIRKPQDTQTPPHTHATAASHLRTRTGAAP